MPIEQVLTRALLVGGDNRAIEILSHCTQQMGIQIEICSDIPSATKKLSRNKFEAVIVDLASGPAGLELIAKLHGMNSHKRAVVFAICGGAEKRKSAFDAGATFVLEVTLSPAIVLRTFRAAYAMMATERRKYFRYPLETIVFVKIEGSSEFKARTIDLSEGGMALCPGQSLNSGDQIQMRLCLPTTTDHLTFAAQVCWTNSKGQAGVAFRGLPGPVRERLQNWLTARLEESTLLLASKGA
jgi:response regulator RpfG family c-di-GMP phosphodiesterase